jgi:hypothetical protein
MVRWAATALPFILLAAPVLGDDMAPKPVGTWVRKGGEASVTFKIKPDGTLSLGMRHERGVLDLTADYGVTRDNVLFGRVSKGPGRGESEGLLFSFKFKAENDKLTLSELTTGKGPLEEVKKLVEGEYDKKTEK